MAVDETEYNSSSKPNAIRPKPQAYSQLEEQLDQAEKASTVPLRMLAIARALTIIFKWNQDNGGTPLTWDLEQNQPYKQWIVQRLLEAAAFTLNDFTEATGVKLDRERATVETTLKKAEQLYPTQRQVWEAALLPQAITGRKGTQLRGGGTVAGNHRAVEFIRLLKRAGGLTRDQLRFLADFPKPQGAAAQHETSETINLLVMAGFARAYECDTWKNSQAELYTLTDTGQIFHSMLQQRDQGSLQPPAPFAPDASLQKLYGTNQILSSISGACKVATNTGKLADLVTKALGQPASYYKEEEPPTLRLEWEESSYRLPSPEATLDLLRPGAVARLILDERQLAQLLLAQANLSSSRTETRFSLNQLEGNAVWPFVIEYDESAEDVEYFASKVTAYVKLYNNPRAWPEKWLGRFPVILVVTAGNSRHLLSLMCSIRAQLRQLTHLRQPQEWWFTTVSWFTAAYADYIGTFNNRRKPRPAYPEMSLALAEKGRVWLPLYALNTEPTENNQLAINSLNFFILHEDYEEKKTVAENLAKQHLDNLAHKLVALPVSHL